MDSTDFETDFQLALARAFRSHDGSVRIAYFDLAQFYFRKVRHLQPMFPPAEVLRDVAEKVAA